MVSGVGFGGHDRDESPVVGGDTLVGSHTVAGPAIWVAGIGRSFVAQPARGVSRFYRARSRLVTSVGSGEVFEDFSGGVAFQDAGDLTHGLAFSETAGNILAGGLVVFHSGEDDVVERRVGLPVPAPVQSVPSGFA